MIIVTGATGALNGATVDHLLQHRDAADLVVVARDVAKAERFARLGVQVRYGDYADPSSLPGAFAGADQLLLVSSSDPHADGQALHRAAIDAAVTAGVGRILYTSHQGAAVDTPFRPGRDHAATEALLAASGVPWTSLRNGFYTHSVAWLMGDWRTTGVVSVPADGPVSWTTREDAAEAAARVIESDGGFDGLVTITAQQAPTFEELAATAAELTGTPVRFEVLSPDEWVAARIAAGAPPAMVGFTLGMYEAAAGGFFAGVDPLLPTLLGRTPTTTREVLSAPVGH
jgi:NAD(P)H dehydrogenase (quinone)